MTAVESRAERALRESKAGFNCAVAVLSAFAEEHGLSLNQARQVAGAFGGGMGRSGAGPCGAASGGLMALGLIYGKTDGADIDASNRCYAESRSFLDAFKTRCGALSCRDLLGFDVGLPDQYEAASEAGAFANRCPHFIKAAIELVEARSEMQYFDQAAATWDYEERRVTLAHAVVEAIASRVALSKEQDVLDFGCGTGLVTLELASRVRSITGADTSPGMLKTLKEKATHQGVTVPLISLDTEKAGSLGGPYDLIVSSMTLHHIAEVPALFAQFMQHLHPGGQIALADLDEEDGDFHDATMSIHHQGFPREQIRTWLQDAGFQEVQLETATVTKKNGKDYPVFLATARKKA